MLLYPIQRKTPRLTLRPPTPPQSSPSLLRSRACLPPPVLPSPSTTITSIRGPPPHPPPPLSPAGSEIIGPVQLHPFTSIENLPMLLLPASSVTGGRFLVLRYLLPYYVPPFPDSCFPSSRAKFGSSLAPASMDKASFSSFSTSSSHSNTSGGRGRGRRSEMKDTTGRARGGGGPAKDKIDALGRLMTRILRHMALELKLDMRSDGYVMVEDLLKLNMKTFANIPLRSHTVDDIREAVRKDNKQRFSLLEENGRLFIRANQGHSVTAVETESLLRPILSTEDFPVCVHGTYKKNLNSILDNGLKRMQRLHVHFACGLPTDGEVISGMRRDINVLIFLDVRKALEEGMKLYISDNKVILTEGFDGVVPVKYFEKIVSWPDRQPVSM